MTFLLSMAVLSGVRWTLSQFLMQRSEMGLKNPLDLIYHVQPWMFLSVIPLMILFERKKLAGLWGVPWDSVVVSEILASSLIAFSMEVAEYLVVAYCSSLTLSVTGVIKEITTIVLSVETEKTKMTVMNYLGLICCVLGVIGHLVHKITLQKDHPDLALSKFYDEAATKFLSEESSSSEDESGRDSPSVVLFSILQSRDDTTISSNN